MAASAKEQHRNTSYRSAIRGTGMNPINEEEAEEILQYSPCPIQLDTEDFDKCSEEEKMNSLVKAYNLICAKVSELDNTLFNEKIGVFCKGEYMSNPGGWIIQGGGRVEMAKYSVKRNCSKTE